MIHYVYLWIHIIKLQCYTFFLTFHFQCFQISVKIGLEERRRKQRDSKFLPLWTFSIVSYKKEGHNISMVQLMGVALSV